MYAHHMARRHEPTAYRPALGKKDLFALAFPDELDAIFLRGRTRDPVSPILQRLADQVDANPQVQLAWLVDTLAYRELDRLAAPGDARLWAHLCALIRVVTHGRWIVETDLDDAKRPL